MTTTSNHDGQPPTRNALPAPPMRGPGVTAAAEAGDHSIAGINARNALAAHLADSGFPHELADDLLAATEAGGIASARTDVQALLDEDHPEHDDTYEAGWQDAIKAADQLLRRTAQRTWDQRAGLTGRINTLRQAHAQVLSQRAPADTAPDGHPGSSPAPGSDEPAGRYRVVAQHTDEAHPGARVLTHTTCARSPEEAITQVRQEHEQPGSIYGDQGPYRIVEVTLQAPQVHERQQEEARQQVLAEITDAAITADARQRARLDPDRATYKVLCDFMARAVTSPGQHPQDDGQLHTSDSARVLSRLLLAHLHNHGLTVARDADLEDARQREAERERLETFVRERVLARTYPNTTPRRQAQEALGEADGLCTARTTDADGDIVVCTLAAGHYDPDNKPPFKDGKPGGWHKAGGQLWRDEKPKAAGLAHTATIKDTPKTAPAEGSEASAELVEEVLAICRRHYAAMTGTSPDQWADDLSTRLLGIALRTVRTAQRAQYPQALEKYLEANRPRLERLWQRYGPDGIYPRGVYHLVESPEVVALCERIDNDRYWLSEAWADDGHDDTPLERLEEIWLYGTAHKEGR
ncbi:hypothetical protein ACFC1B_07530 [Streptomyces xiamenensis]|uniref:hypothetical protein n=1 Tax=Streptomyces xiamenensis TaxID=408015 RepID=UPI0035D87BF7